MAEATREPSLEPLLVSLGIVVVAPGQSELELELILSQMAQKPMLRGEVGARALRVRSDFRGHRQVRLCKALGCGRCGCLKPIRACCV